MELQQLLETRRSTRAYVAGVQIQKDEIEAAIKAAQLAPSWKNSQTARYYVAVDAEAMAKVKAGLPEFNQKNVADAAGLIVTTFEAKRAGFERDGNPTNELGDEWGAYDLGLAHMALLLKLKELGYDTLVMGIRDEKLLRETLSIPDSQHVVAVIGLGKGAGTPSMPARKNLDEIVKFI